MTPRVPLDYEMPAPGEKPPDVGDIPVERRHGPRSIRIGVTAAALFLAGAGLRAIASNGWQSHATLALWGAALVGGFGALVAAAAFVAEDRTRLPLVGLLLNVASAIGGVLLSG